MSSTALLRVMLFAPVALLLAACGNDGGSTTTTPAGGTNFNFDKDDTDNVVGVLFDEPVVGLRYSCLPPGGGVFNSVTDSVGEFVCPDGSRVQFRFGPAEQLLLGEIDLALYPADGKFGLPVADLVGFYAYDNPVKLRNIVLALQAFRLAAYDDRVVLPRDVDDRLLKLVAKGFSFDLPHRQFRDLLEPVVRQAGRDFNLMFGGALPSGAVVDRAISEMAGRSRAGLYRTLGRGLGEYGSNGLPEDHPDFEYANPALNIIVDRAGRARGIGYVLVQDPEYWRYKTVLLGDGATIGDNGVLADFITDGVNGDMGLVFRGRMILDRMYPGREALFAAWSDTLAGTATSPLPKDYEYDGQDAGRWTERGPDAVFSGPLGLNRYAAASPYLETDPIPASLLPLHYRLDLDTYKNGRFVTIDGRKNPAQREPAGLLHISILPGGDIVSDLDADCADIDPVTLLDTNDGSQEYRLGILGRGRLDGRDPVATLSILVSEPTLQLQGIAPEDASALGLVLGVPSTLLSNTGFARFNFATNLLEPVDGCADAFDRSCPEQVEWINDHKLVLLSKAVYNVTPVKDIGNEEAETFKVPGYYGQVSSRSGLTACPP